MTWKIEWDERALKEAKRLSREARQQIVAYLKEKIANNQDPRRFGKPLTANLAGLWRYRSGDYRIICRIEDHKLVILVVKIGHRKDVYD